MHQLSDNRRTALATHGFTSVDQFADRFLQMEAEAGRDRILLPGENATPEQRAAFNKAIGVPGEVAGYKFPTGDGVDPRMTEWAGPAFLKHGVTAQAAAGLTTDWMKFMSDVVAKEQNDAATAAKEDDTKLRAEWKGGYERNVATVRRLGEYLGWSEKTVGAVARAEGDYSKGMQGLLKLADLLAEDGAHPGGGSTFTITTAQEAEQELGRMKGDPSMVEALTNANHPQHKTVQQKWDRLQEMKVGIRGPQQQGAR